MSAPAGRIRRVAPGPLDAVLLLVPGLLAFGLVLYSLSRPTGLYGVTEYDDGVYFASALRLIAGIVPYRDYAFVQPPGITLLMTPFALVSHVTGSRDALGIVRVVTGIVAGLNAVLIGVLVSHRGRIASFVGGGLFAIFPPAWAADHTLMLEPYLVLFVLIGCVVLFKNGRLGKGADRLVAGGAFGVAMAVKAFALVPLLGLILVSTVIEKRFPRRLVLGAIGTVAVICLPFFLLAPHQFFHEVVGTQLDRNAAVPTHVLVRIAALTGLVDSTVVPHLHAYVGTPLLAAGIIIFFVTATSLVPSLRRRGEDLEAYALVGLVATVAILFFPPEFYDHYAYVSATFLCLVIGYGTSRVVSFFERLARSSPSLTVASRLLIVVVVLIFLLGSTYVVIGEARYDSYATAKKLDVGPLVEAAIPRGSCVLTDEVSILVTSNRLSEAKGCPRLVDSTGAWLSADPSEPPSLTGRRDPRLVSQWAAWFKESDYVVFSLPHTFRVPWTPALSAEFTRLYRRIGPESLVIYERRTIRPSSKG